jgi:hypothetical protein
MLRMRFQRLLEGLIDRLLDNPVILTGLAVFIALDIAVLVAAIYRRRKK